jgi:hypothetical protein
MGHAQVVLPEPERALRPAVFAQATPATAVALWRPAHDTRSVNARGPPVLL